MNSEKKKKTVGRPSRKDRGLEPLVQITTKVEKSVKKNCIKKYGTIGNALRFAGSA